jgi:hypothetical protein
VIDGFGGGGVDAGGGGGAWVGVGDGFGVLVFFGFGGGGVYGSWPDDGAVPSRFAGGGKSSTGRPSISALIVAAQVAVG